MKEIIHDVDPGASIEDAVDRERWKTVCNCCQWFVVLINDDILRLYINREKFKFFEM